MSSVGPGLVYWGVSFGGLLDILLVRIFDITWDRLLKALMCSHKGPHKIFIFLLHGYLTVLLPNIKHSTFSQKQTQTKESLTQNSLQLIAVKSPGSFMCHPKTLLLNTSRSQHKKFCPQLGLTMDTGKNQWNFCSHPMSAVSI